MKAVAMENDISTVIMIIIFLNNVNVVAAIIIITTSIPQPRNQNTREAPYVTNHSKI
jgi:hypothetical protein